jgi:hypothetical protein
MRSIIGSHTLGAPVSIDGVRGADGFVGTPRPTVSAQPGNRSAFFGDDFVGYRLSFLSAIVFMIVPFPILNVNNSGFILKQKDRRAASRSRDGLFYS